MIRTWRWVQGNEYIHLVLINISREKETNSVNLKAVLRILRCSEWAANVFAYRGMEVLLSRIETTYYCFFVADYMHLLVFYSSSAASCSELWYKTQECVDCICKLQKDPIIKHFKKKTKNWELLIYKGRRIYRPFWTFGHGMTWVWTTAGYSAANMKNCFPWTYM